MKLRSILMVGLMVACATPRSQPLAEVADFFLDPAGKAYFLLGDSRLVTDNPLGENRYDWFDSSLGAPDDVDVTNPFQILVYYREYGTAVVLDRTLSELDRVDLFASPHIEQPGVIARSYTGGIWVFDEWTYRLLELDGSGGVSQRTNNLRLELDEPGVPRAIFVGRNKVMLHFAEEERSRLAVFTNYGEFEGWVELPAADRLSWYAPRLLGLAAGESWVWEAGRGGPGRLPLRVPLERDLPPGRIYAGAGQLLYADLVGLKVGYLRLR